MQDRHSQARVTTQPTLSDWILSTTSTAKIIKSVNVNNTSPLDSDHYPIELTIATSALTVEPVHFQPRLNIAKANLPLFSRLLRNNNPNSSNTDHTPETLYLAYGLAVLSNAHGSMPLNDPGTRSSHRKRKSKWRVAALLFEIKSVFDRVWHNGQTKWSTWAFQYTQ